MVCAREGPLFTDTKKVVGRITIDMPRRLLGIWFFLTLICLCQAQITKGQMPPRELPFTPPNKWAMVIGASDYKTLGKLNFAAKDAEAFAGVLKERFGFASDSIELLTDSPESTQKPTVDQIQDALNRKLQDKRLNKGDLFIFYFSGHGIGTPKGDFLMPTDATVEEAERSGQSVKSIVESFVKAGLRNVLVIVDACRGGEKNTFGSEFRQLGREANIAVMLSCEPGERSYEYPRLGHGVFTSYLLRSLKSSELPSPATGTLWASSVFKDVGQKVRDYTVRDYPTKPQNPAGWADPTMDVALGLFQSKAQVRLKLSDLLAEGERLSQKEYADYLNQVGIRLVEQERHAEAIEVFKSLEGLQPLESATAYCYSLSLSAEGRTFEAAKVLANLGKGDKDDAFTYLATLYSPSRSISPSDRVEAAQKLWSLQPTEWTLQVAYPALDTYGSSYDTQKFIDLVLQQSNLPKRSKLFFEGIAASAKSDWDTARARLEEALVAPGDYPTNSLIHIQIYLTLVQTNRVSEMEAYLQKISGSPDTTEGYWSLLLAQYYKETQRPDDMIAALKQALTKQLNPDELLRTIRIAGARYVQIGDQIIALADKKPAAWKARLAKDWVQKAGQDPTSFLAAINESKVYSDDEFWVMYECMEILDSIFDDSIAIGALPADQYSQFMVAFSAIMASEVDKFGYQSHIWILFNKFAVNAEKLEQAQALYNLYLGPRLDNGTLDPLLRAPYLFIALQVDDVKRVEQLWKLGGMPSADQRDAQWLISMFYAARGDLEKAKSLLPKGEPSPTFGPASDTYRIYLKVKSGEKPDLKLLAKKYADSPSAMHWLALASVELGDWDTATQILEQNVLLRQQGFFFLQAKATEIYFQRLIAQKEFDKANDLAHNISLSGYGNPIYAKIHYGPQAKVAQFAGKIELDTLEFEYIPQFEQGSLSLTIDSSGNVTGSSVKAGTGRPIVGKVDEYGNLRASLKDEGKEWTITGKIAPPALYSKLPAFKTSFQGFLLMDAKGQARYLMGRYPGGEGG